MASSQTVSYFPRPLITSGQEVYEESVFLCNVITVFQSSEHPLSPQYTGGTVTPMPSSWLPHVIDGKLRKKTQLIELLCFKYPVLVTTAPEGRSWGPGLGLERTVSWPQDRWPELDWYQPSPERVQEKNSINDGLKWFFISSRNRCFFMDVS